MIKRATTRATRNKSFKALFNDFRFPPTEIIFLWRNRFHISVPTRPRGRDERETLNIYFSSEATIKMLHLVCSCGKSIGIFICKCHGNFYGACRIARGAKLCLDHQNVSLESSLWFTHSYDKHENCSTSADSTLSIFASSHFLSTSHRENRETTTESSSQQRTHAYYLSSGSWSFVRENS